MPENTGQTFYHTIKDVSIESAAGLCQDMVLKIGRLWSFSQKSTTVASGHLRVKIQLHQNETTHTLYITASVNL
jgi:hypothetical protein